MAPDRDPKPREETVSTVENPPTSWLGILSRLGPGLIIAASIVGSGELIGTTLTGAEGGFSLLWAILIGCIIKVWAQIELGRYSLLSGHGTLRALNEVPGPAAKLGGYRINWLAFYWLLMFLVSLGQLGGIVGYVGQVMAIAVPISEQGKQASEATDKRVRTELRYFQTKAKASRAEFDGKESFETEASNLEEELKSLRATPVEGNNRDELIWAIGFTAITVWLLVFGGYGLIEKLMTLLVAIFTLVSVLTVLLVQFQPEYAIQWSEILSGLSFRLPPGTPGKNPVHTALATFGIIGVGANELIQYPYWCLEKGYARFTGPRQSDPSSPASRAWADRANGWMTVLKCDAWLSLVVYTFATLAFFLLGAGILGRIGFNPRDSDMIRTLAAMYEPVFGTWTHAFFLFGAFAVLYSTFVAASAGHARVCGEAMKVFFNASASPENQRRWVAYFSAILPVLSLVLYLYFKTPKALILASGAMQAMMLPMLAFAAIYLHYRERDDRIGAKPAFMACLWFSAFVMLVAGVWVAIANGQNVYSALFGVTSG